jgi:hypothetical protein
MQVEQCITVTLCCCLGSLNKYAAAAASSRPIFYIFQLSAYIPGFPAVINQGGVGAIVCVFSRHVKCLQLVVWKPWDGYWRYCAEFARRPSIYFTVCVHHWSNGHNSIMVAVHPQTKTWTIPGQYARLPSKLLGWQYIILILKDIPQYFNYVHSQGEPLLCAHTFYILYRRRRRYTDSQSSFSKTCLHFHLSSGVYVNMPI